MFGSSKQYVCARHGLAGVRVEARAVVGALFALGLPIPPHDGFVSAGGAGGWATGTFGVAPRRRQRRTVTVSGTEDCHEGKVRASLVARLSALYWVQLLVLEL